MTISSSIVTDGNADVQYYDTSSGEFLPDLRITPYVFKLKATKIEGKDAEMQEVTSFVDATFHELVDGVWKPLSSGSDIELDASKATFKLKSNIQVGNFRTFRIDAKIADSRQAGKYAPISQQIQVYCKPMSEDAITLVPEYPDGRKMNILQKLDTYRLKALMRKGTSELNNVWYRWYRTDGGVETEITSANAGLLEGYDGPVLKIPAYGEVDTKTRHYRAVAHPQTDLTGINQISKSMIYDDWNDVKAGLSVKGEDADGVYYAISTTDFYLTFYQKNIFPKLSFKKNQRYILSAKSKLLKTQDNYNLFFKVVYTDGYEGYAYIFSNGGPLSTKHAITAENKTVSYIIVSYSNGDTYQKTLIYDIQLMEYNEGDSTEPAFRPAIADGLTPKPAFSNSDLSVRMAMSKVYPQPLNKELIVTSGGDLPVGVNMFEAECRLQSNTGTLENPEYDYSFVWKNRPASSGVWKEFARGRRILMPFTEEMDLDCSYTPGLDKAKYAACFDGVDDNLKFTSQANSIPIFGSTLQVNLILNELEFRPMNLIDICNNNERLLLYYSSVFSNGITIAQITNTSVEYYTVDYSYLKKGMNNIIIQIGSTNDSSPLVSINGNSCPLIANGDGSLRAIQDFEISFSINPISDTAYLSNFKFLKGDETYINFDFQPVNGDRSAMLKNKNEDGSINKTNPITLTAENIDNLNELNPKYAFFKPI